MRSDKKDLFKKYAESAAMNVNRSEADPDGKTFMISTDLIDENPDNAKVFSMDKVDFLAKDIKKHGFSGAIIVRKKDDGRYEVVSGHQRLRAVKELNKTEIRCFIKDYSDTESVTEDLLLSNLNNRDITTVQKSNAVKLYFDKVLDKKYPDETKTVKMEKAAEFFNMSASNVELLLSLQTLDPKLMVYADMPGFPIHGLSGTKHLTNEQTERLVSMIESTPGFKEYREGNEHCPLSVRSLKTLIKNMDKEKEVKKNTAPLTKSCIKYIKASAGKLEKADSDSAKIIINEMIEKLTELLKSYK